MYLKMRFLKEGNMLEKLFKLKENGTDAKTEILESPHL